MIFVTTREIDTIFGTNYTRYEFRQLILVWKGWKRYLNECSKHAWDLIFTSFVEIFDFYLWPNSFLFRALIIQMFRSLKNIYIFYFGESGGIVDIVVRQM